jgi:hypothetical protein
MQRPDLVVPKFDILINNASELAPGYLFIATYAPQPAQTTPTSALLQTAPLIYDTLGNLVWRYVPAIFPSLEHV